MLANHSYSHWNYPRADFDAFSQGSSDVLGLTLTLTGGTGADAMADDKRRFNPMRLTGTLDQDTRRMTGRFIAATPAVGGTLPVVAIGLDNDPLRGKGSLSFDTIDLKFAPGALQPHHLSPLATSIMTSDVSGTASFTGRFDWSPAGGSSGGVLVTEGMNFTGPAGIAELPKPGPSHKGGGKRHEPSPRIAHHLGSYRSLFPGAACLSWPANPL